MMMNSRLLPLDRLRASDALCRAVFFVLLLLPVPGLCTSSSAPACLVLVTLAAIVQPHVQNYTPPHGRPASPFVVDAAAQAGNRSSPFLDIRVNGTWPSVGYRYTLMAVSTNGTAPTTDRVLRQGVAYSSPGKPVLVSIAATERTCTLAYAPPREPYSRLEHVSFYIEYSPVQRRSPANSSSAETVFFARTNASSVRLRRLEPGTQYRLALFTEFFGVRSLCPLEVTFRTKSAVVQPNITAEAVSKAPTTTTDCAPPTPTTAPTIATSSPASGQNGGQETATSNPGEMEEGESGPGEGEGGRERERDETEVGEDSAGGEEEAEGGDGAGQERRTTPASGNVQSGIRVRQADRSHLRLDWTVPELVPCDAFLLHHRVLDALAIRRVDAVRVSLPSAQIPLVPNARIEANVSCLFENTVSPQWSARRVIDLHKPMPVSKVRILRSWTDEFFQSSVLLGVAVTSYTDFRLYELQMAWAQGKKVVGRQTRVFRGETMARDGLEGRVNITGLEPAKLYTFAVRNVSRELVGQSSAPIGLRLTTPPIITSTVYAGKLSSHSINVNFGESDPAHPFDGYELHFAGDHNNNGSASVIRRLGKEDPKSFTFNKLVPGKTYTFSLYTMLKGVRSRPVSANITTYPLKVASLHPLIGPGYVLLFWQVQNAAQNECRFRLSYTASAGPHLHRALSLELNDTVSSHRFSGLEWNTFYTFTITVIMGPPGAEAESESEAITVGIAGRPRSTPQLKRYGSRELLLAFENDAEVFADRNGAIHDFAIIVAEKVLNTEEDEDSAAQLAGDVWDLPSWHDVREREEEAMSGGHSSGVPWIAYRATPDDYNPFLGRRGGPRIAQFIIGSEDCVPERRRLDEPFCNGPLRTHVDYFVRIRAFSVAGIAMETPWVGIDGSVPLEPKRQEQQQQQQRRLPCYMYLNGCAKSGCASSRSNPFCWSLSQLLFLLILVLISRCR